MRVPGEEEIAVHSGGPGSTWCAEKGERKEVVRTARPRLSMRADGLRPQARWGSVQ
jgi:hypothetical protein